MAERWIPSPFGDTRQDDDADGDGNTFTLNLRFPGQYYDEETGTFYNYFRDYDPRTGWYVQSDPIGLRGGLNTYFYVESSPLVYTDPFGDDPNDQYWINEGAKDFDNGFPLQCPAP